MLSRVEICILQSHLSGGVGQLRVPRQTLGFPFGVHVLQRVKILHFTGNPTFEFGRVEGGDWADTAPACQDGFPECFDTNSVRGNNSDSSNDDAISSNHFRPLF